MIGPADLRGIPLFEGVSDAQLEDLIAAGEEISFAPGDELFHEGAQSDHWFVLLEVEIDLLRHFGREDMLLARLDRPGRWAGGFQAWDPSGAYLATGRATTHGRVLCVPAADLRSLTVQWFPFSVHIIDGVFNTARSVEEGARQRAALVKLGTLAAGLAHELNNPAAAATRAVDALEDASQGVLASLGGLAQSDLSPELFSELDRRRRQVVAPARPLDPLAAADREDELSDWLGERGVARSWDLAPVLAGANVDVPWCEDVAELVGDAALGSALEWVASTLSVATLLAQVKESTRRISDLVSAVRTYSQMDRGSTQRIDITEGLESTLVMLGHRLKDGITVQRDYAAELAEVEAFPGELNQVWTNLIENAVDAMDGQGTLGVVTRALPAEVVVEIRDTGSGFAPGAEGRAFEAFFTTKEVGKGTGLGLDIARRIVVDRHFGTITIDSRPGDTVVRVTLPITPPRT